MNKFTIQKEHPIRDALLEYANDNIYIEGSLLKLLTYDKDDVQLKKYFDEAKKRDKQLRRKRLYITKRIQVQNDELERHIQTKNKLTKDLEKALKESKRNEQVTLQLKEKSDEERNIALKDLEVLRKKTEFKLMNLIVKTALTIIIGVGVTTTFLYAYILSIGGESTIIETTWSNLLGILITNSFSIIGTIMGVRYVNDKMEGKEPKFGL